MDDESEDYGFFGGLALDDWNRGYSRAMRALERDNKDEVLREAYYVIESYDKHRQNTDRWDKIVTFLFVIAIVFAIAAGRAGDGWIGGIIAFVIGAIPAGLINTKIVDKRIALANAFHDSYQELVTMVTELTDNK